MHAPHQVLRLLPIAPQRLGLTKEPYVFSTLAQLAEAQDAAQLFRDMLGANEVGGGGIAYVASVLLDRLVGWLALG